MAKSKCRWECPDQWSEWSEWLAAGLHATNRWRLPVLLVGILFASGRRTVTTWLRAAGVSPRMRLAVGDVATGRRIAASLALPIDERLLYALRRLVTRAGGPNSS